MNNARKRALVNMMKSRRMRGFEIGGGSKNRAIEAFKALKNKKKLPPNLGHKPKPQSEYKKMSIEEYEEKYGL